MKKRKMGSSKTYRADNGTVVRYLRTETGTVEKVTFLKRDDNLQKYLNRGCMQVTKRAYLQYKDSLRSKVPAPSFKYTDKEGVEHDTHLLLTEGSIRSSKRKYSCPSKSMMKLQAVAQKRYARALRLQEEEAARLRAEQPIIAEDAAVEQVMQEETPIVENPEVEILETEVV